MKNLRRRASAILLAASLTGPPLFAAIPLEEAQQLLQKEEFYFGEPSGKLDDDTRAALRRFQIHRGLPVTGDLDAATETALNALLSPAPGVAAPETRSVREVSREVERSDREFLEQIEMEEPPRTTVLPKATPRPVATATPAKAPSPAEEEEKPTTRSGMTEAAARDFVGDYIEAASRGSAEAEVAFYADQVNYFDSGRVSRGFIARDQRNYRRRWPTRDFDLIGEPQLTNAREDTATIRFRVAYRLSGDDEKASGRTENVIRLRKTDDGWRIVAIAERKLSS